MKKETNKNSLKKEHFAKLIVQTDEKLKNALGEHTLINNEGPRKFSEIFISFINPLLEGNMNNDTEVNDILNFGLFIWNKCVADNFPEHSKSKNINLLFPLFYATFGDKNLINEFIHRKQTLFNNDNFIIFRFETQFDANRNMSISVAVLQMEA